MKVYIYQLIIEYGFYLILLFAGSGYYVWRRFRKFWVVQIFSRRWTAL